MGGPAAWRQLTSASERSELTPLSKPLRGRCSEGKFSSSPQQPEQAASRRRERLTGVPRVWTGPESPPRPQRRPEAFSPGSVEPWPTLVLHSGPALGPWKRLCRLLHTSTQPLIGPDPQCTGPSVVPTVTAVHLSAESLWEVFECLLWDYQAGAGGRAADGAGGSHGEDPLLARNAVQVRGTAGRSRGTLGDGAGAFVNLVSHQRSRIIIPLPAKSTPPASRSLHAGRRITPPPESTCTYLDTQDSTSKGVQQTQHDGTLVPSPGQRGTEGVTDQSRGWGGVIMGLEVSPFMQPVKHG